MGSGCFFSQRDEIFHKMHFLNFRSICCITTYQDFFCFLRVQANPKVSTRCMGIRSYLILTSKKRIKGRIFPLTKSFEYIDSATKKRERHRISKISILARLDYKYKVNRCLARYSPRVTTTNRPTNRALNKPAWPGPN